MLHLRLLALSIRLDSQSLLCSAISAAEEQPVSEARLASTSQRACCAFAQLHRPLATAHTRAAIIAAEQVSSYSLETWQLLVSAILSRQLFLTYSSDDSLLLLCTSTICFLHSSSFEANYTTSKRMLQKDLPLLSWPRRLLSSQATCGCSRGQLSRARWQHHCW